MDTLHNTNQILYKYRVWREEGKEIQLSRRLLTDNEIYFAAPDQFNDPFDCSLPFKYKKDSLTEENIYQKLLQIARQKFPNESETFIQNHCLEIQSKQSLSDENYWKTFYPYFKKQMNSTFGIFSLTPKRDNLLMWSHYADSHSGFCVGLDRNILFDICKPFVQMGKVIYDSSFPEVVINENATSSILKLTMTKSIDWSYEEEYRMLSFGNKKVVSISNEAVKEILLGHRMKEEYKNEIFRLAETKFKEAIIYETQMNNEYFKIDLLPILKKQNNG